MRARLGFPPPRQSRRWSLRSVLTINMASARAGLPMVIDALASALVTP